MNSYLDYPNPVLSADRDDYIEGCSFDVLFDEEMISVDDEYINIPARYELKSEGLLKYVKNGTANIVVLIYSSGTMFRNAYVFDADKSEMPIRIPKFNVKDDIEFSGYILANENIDNYRLDEFNDLYFKGIPFAVKKADVLAKGIERRIPVDDSELEKPISSIFSINKNEDAEMDVEADFETDQKIIINLCEELNQLYWAMRDSDGGALRRYLNGIIVYPVLVEAIAKMVDTYREIGTDYSEKRWFRTIEHKLQNLNIDLSEDPEKYSYTALADKLLGNIAKDGLKSVKETLDRELNNGEYTQIGGVD